MPLGTILSGDSATARLRITNRTSQPVSIARFDVGCPCVTISPGALIVPASGEATVRVTFDSREDQGFHGELAVRVKAFAEDTSFVVATDVIIVVTAANR